MDVVKTGTTTIGIVCKDGIVLAADKRATVGGHFNANTVRKIVKLNDRFALTISGSVADAELLTRHIKAELKIKELRARNHVTVREAANLLGQFVYHNVRTPSMIPGITHFLFAGRDHTGTHLYDVFADGTIININDYFASGSGSTYAMAVLDKDYNKEIPLKEGVKMAKNAMRSALMRDTASGNGYDVITISKEGITDIESVTFDPQIAIS